MKRVWRRKDHDAMVPAGPLPGGLVLGSVRAAVLGGSISGMHYTRDDKAPRVLLGDAAHSPAGRKPTPHSTFLQVRKNEHLVMFFKEIFYT